MNAINRFLGREPSPHGDECRINEADRRMDQQDSRLKAIQSVINASEEARLSMLEWETYGRDRRRSPRTP